MNDIEKTKGWLGVVMIVWPLIRFALMQFGVALPDLHLPMDMIGPVSQGAGTMLLARADSLKKRS